MSLGSLFMWTAWTVAFVLVGAGWVIDDEGVQNLGLAAAAAAASLTIMRDNQRTRRMLRRPGETVAPMRRRP